MAFIIVLDILCVTVERAGKMRLKLLDVLVRSRSCMARPGSPDVGGDSLRQTSHCLSCPVRGVNLLLALIHFSLIAGLLALLNALLRCLLVVVRGGPRRLAKSVLAFLRLPHRHLPQQCASIAPGLRPKGWPSTFGLLVLCILACSFVI